MFDVFFEKASRLHADGETFALAMVVRYEAPSSGKTGDKAIITQDGSIEGWIGGGCTQPVIIREAMNVIADGKPRLIRIAPSTDDRTEGIVTYPMTCHSGGALDVYIEPVYPKPHLVVFGRSVVARTLVRLAKAIHYKVTLVVGEADPALVVDADAVLVDWEIHTVPANKKTFAVVATQGEGDEDALRQVISRDWGYQAFVASRKKSAEVFKVLEGAGVDPAGLSLLHVPAGLDIKAKLPEEIAVSILAEIIQETRNAEAREKASSEKTVSKDYTSEVLDIGEMSCAHCVATVEKVLKEIQGLGVGKVEIGSAEVTYLSGQIDYEEIARALDKRGYVLKH